MTNGITVMGPEARRLKWAAWCIARAAGGLWIGRLHEKKLPDGISWERYLSPFYDFNSGFVPTPQGLQETHRAFPPLALSLKRVDLPEHGYVLWPFSDLDDRELQGMEECVKNAEELWGQMRAARSNVMLAPPFDLSKLPKMPRQ